MKMDPLPRTEPATGDRSQERLIDRDELLAMVPYTIQHIYRKEKAGTFPRRVRIGHNRVAWVLSEVMDWMRARMAERDSGARGRSL